MNLKKAIIEEMSARQMRKAARKLKVAADNYREKNALEAGLRKSRGTTAVALLDFLSERDIKRICGKLGLESKGRRKALISRLVAATNQKTGDRGVATTRKRGGDLAGKEGRRSVEKSNADLHFGPSSDRTGFTPAGISAFSDLRPSAVVRELIQNSLDAALIEAGEPRACVRFERTTCRLDEVPGIASYRLAFDRAVAEQSPSGSARAVVDRIERTLCQETHDLLCVTDNGVGLDASRMSALLSDGVSAKGGNASGTFGNGHSVVLPASNLRYVLYGGLLDDGTVYGGGQAVLASHRVDGELWNRSGRGVYVESVKRDEDGNPYSLVRGDAMPQVIGSAIERVRADYGHGAAVVIPAFNNFEHEQSLEEAVFRAAAFNFFQAVHEGLLEVQVDDGNVGVLDSSTLADVLARYRGETRVRRTGAFLSGRKANDAYEALVEGERHEIETSQGQVTVRLLRRETGRRSVGLCRNGMWITDELPMFQNAFGDRQPFQALILLRSDRNNGFFDLIREAETPLHDKLALRQMEPKRRTALRNALREVRDQIAELVPASTEDVYNLADILEFQFDDLEGQRQGGRQPSFWGRVGSTRRSTTTRATENGQGTEENERSESDGGHRRRHTRSRSNRRVVVAPVFRIASVPIGVGRRKVQVECAEALSDAVLRMFVDENVDATCDRQTRGQAAPVLLSNVMVDGRLLDDDELVGQAGSIVGARLGSLDAQARVVVETDCVVPSTAMQLLPGQDPAIRIEILGGADATNDLGGAEADGEPSDD